MNIQKIKKLFLLTIVWGSVSMLLFSCVNPLSYMESAEDIDGVDDIGETDTDPMEASKILVQGSSFTLAWDAPDEENVTGYNVYYRTHGDTNWALLEESGVTEITISTTELEYGEYDFAVTALLNEGESEYHTSLDTEAEPDNGWFLDWQEG